MTLSIQAEKSWKAYNFILKSRKDISTFSNIFISIIEHIEAEVIVNKFKAQIFTDLYVSKPKNVFFFFFEMNPVINLIFFLNKIVRNVFEKF